MADLAKMNSGRMTRGQFLRSAGVGAAALGAIAMGKSGTAGAASGPKVFSMGFLNSNSGTLSQKASNVTQFNMAIEQLNLLGHYQPGAANQQLFSFSGASYEVSAATIHPTLDSALGGLDAVVGALNSSIALSTTGNTTPAYQRITGAGIAYGECRATADSMTSNVDAVTGDIISPIVPLGLFRTIPTSSNYGEAEFLSIGLLGIAAAGTKALCVRDPGDSRSYGWASSLKFKQSFEQVGGMVITSGGYDPGFAFTTSWTVTQFEAYIKGFLAYCPPGTAPDLICGAWVGSGEFLKFHQAWFNLQAADYNGLGASMSQTRFVHVGSLATLTNAGYSFAGYPGAQAIIASNRLITLQPWFDASSKGYMEWRNLFSGPIEWDKQLRVFDATMLLGLALMGTYNNYGSTDNSRVNAKLLDINNPNDVKIYPGQKLNQMFGLLRQAQAMNYEGASGSCDISPNGDIVSPVFRVYTTNSDASINELATFLL